MADEAKNHWLFFYYFVSSAPSSAYVVVTEQGGKMYSMSRISAERGWMRGAGLFLTLHLHYSSVCRSLHKIFLFTELLPYFFTIRLFVHTLSCCTHSYMEMFSSCRRWCCDFQLLFSNQNIYYTNIFSTASVHFKILFSL